MTDHSRRKFNKMLGGSTALIPLGLLLSSRSAAAAAVDPESAQAKALGYILETENKEQICAGCLFYTSVDDEKGKCAIFANGEVPAGAWCTSFQAKQ